MNKLLGTSIACLTAIMSMAQSSGVKILSPNLDVKVTRLSQLNSKHEETNISITPSGKVMYYMSDRGGQNWSQVYGMRKGVVRYDGDIWYSIKRGDTWSSPKCLNSSINSSKGEDEPNVAPDGRRVSFQSWMDGWENNGGPYYTSRLAGTHWSPPRGLGGGVTAFFKREYEKYGGYGTDGMSISPDGKRFVVACGRDYYGKLDLYMSTKTSSGRWGPMKRLSISTRGDERSVFWGADSKTLYFSSDGYAQGMGGLDIYKTVIKSDGSHGQIINLGKRFNTTSDDYGFIIAASGEEAYFVRNGDIYQAKIKDPPPEMLPTATALVQGKVKLKEEGKPDKSVKALLKLVDVATGKVINTAYSNAIDGHYSIYISDARKKYKIQMFKGGEMKEEKVVNLVKNKAYQEVVVNFDIVIKKDPPVVEQPKPATAKLTGKVQKEKDGRIEVLETKIQLVDAKTGKVVKEVMTNPTTGKYSIKITDVKKKYKVQMFYSGVMKEEKAFELADKQYQEVKVDFKVIEMTPPKKDTTKQNVVDTPPDNEDDEIVIVNYKVFQYIHFAYEHVSLTSKAKFKLIQTIRYMKDNPKAKFLVTGYDDNRAPRHIEKKIAKDRALSVASFLIGGGIDQDRLVLEYYTNVYHQQKFDKYPYPAIRLTELSLLSKNKRDFSTHNLINLDKEDMGDAGLGGFGLFNELAMEKKEVEKQIEIFNDFKNGYTERGIINYLMGDYKSATLDFNKAIDLDKVEGVVDIETYYFRAMTHFEQKKYEEAKKDLDLALGEEPEYVDALMARADVLYNLGMAEMALIDWKRANEVHPGIASEHIAKHSTVGKPLPAATEEAVPAKN